MSKSLLVAFVAILFTGSFAAAKDYSITSPDGTLAVTLKVSDKITWNITRNGSPVLGESQLSLLLTDGTAVGINPKVVGVKKSSTDILLDAPLYKNSQVRDRHNSLILKLKGGWSLELRVFDDGAAYRFISNVASPYQIENEQVEYNFPQDWKIFTPYVRGGVPGDFQSQFFNSFENLYTETPISGMDKERLSFLPALVDCGNGLKACITEVNIEDYPGLYVYNPDGGRTLKSVFAPYPKTVVPGGYNNIQGIVKETEGYIAKVSAPRAFPWRAVLVGTDVQIASSNLNWLLAEPSRIDDISWIKPGKVAWDWWNDWNIKGVDFRAGINTETYKYYIDFAASKGIEYVIMDDGWAAGKGEDLFKINPDIDLEAILAHAESKGVGIILWAGYYAFEKDLEKVCEHYSKMGVKGFKVDFHDRDDQMMTEYDYRCAEVAAKYHLILDMHGAHKPAGINRTWPNVMNNEGVHGLENAKWSSIDCDLVHYDVTIPFTRQVAGPMDYTQGAMRNGTRHNFRAVNSEPMSQGTRCHQLGLYMILDSPLNMLCDSPTNYLAEPECTEFIASVPTVWDETTFIDGAAGEYAVASRRSGEMWYVGGITDWTARTYVLNLSFLGEGEYEMVLFRDGVNADRNAADFKLETRKVTSSDSVEIVLAPGGGFAARFTK